INGNASHELYPLGVHGFVEEDSSFTFSDDESVIMVKFRGMPWNLFVRLFSSIALFNIFRRRALKSIDVRVVLFACRSLPRKSDLTIDLRDFPNLKQGLTPSLETVEVVRTDDGILVVVRGLNLESILLRGNPQGYALANDGITSAQLPSSFTAAF